MDERRNNVFGTISLVLISLLNLFFAIPFFVSMLIEQIRIGVGTSLELAVILIWFLGALLSVPFIVCVVFTIISIVKRDYLPKIIINLSQIVLYLVFFILANVWIVV